MRDDSKKLSATADGLYGEIAVSERFLQEAEVDQLLDVLEARFHENMGRHTALNWNDVRARLLQAPEKLWALQQMEITGGEPDVVEQEEETGAYVFVDCVKESPKERRSLCYDQEALARRKANKPAGSAVSFCEAIGVEMLSVSDYKRYQAKFPMDEKTSTWLKTPEDIRKLGGALFGDRRYETVFIYHNGADSYYSSRGVRGVLRV